MLKTQASLDDNEAVLLKSLLPDESLISPDFDIHQFLILRYPALVASYGGQKEEHEAEAFAWNHSLHCALHEAYFNEICQLKTKSPNTWAVLKQYPSIIQHLSHHASF